MILSRLTAILDTVAKSPGLRSERPGWPRALAFATLIRLAHRSFDLATKEGQLLVILTAACVVFLVIDSIRHRKEPRGRFILPRVLGVLYATSTFRMLFTDAARLNWNTLEGSLTISVGIAAAILLAVLWLKHWKQGYPHAYWPWVFAVWQLVPLTSPIGLCLLGAIAALWLHNRRTPNSKPSAAVLELD